MVADQDNRSKIIEETVQNTFRNAEFMKAKYDNKKKRSVAEFNIGDNVVLHVKKCDRRNATLRNIPCVIIHKTHGNQPQYRLLCRVGVISKMVNASSLSQYPGSVDTGPKDVRISIREAARQILNPQVTSCSCVSLPCNKIQCKCYASGVACSSRCHKANNNNCKNRAPKEHSIIPSLPEFGGSYHVDAQTYHFLNTCPVDTWLAILRSFQECGSLANLPGSINNVYDLVRQEDYNKAKFQVGCDLKLFADNRRANFFGNEYDLFVRPYLTELLESQQKTICSNQLCPKKEFALTTNSGPQINFEESLDFSQQINNWFKMEHFSICSQQTTALEDINGNYNEDVDPKTGLLFNVSVMYIWLADIVNYSLIK